MTDLERALAAGAVEIAPPKGSDLERALAAGANPIEANAETPDEQAQREAFLKPGGTKGPRLDRIGRANQQYRAASADFIEPAPAAPPSDNSFFPSGKPYAPGSPEQAQAKRFSAYEERHGITGREPLEKDFIGQQTIGTILGGGAGRLFQALATPLLGPAMARVFGAGMAGGTGSEVQGGDFVPGFLMGAAPAAGGELASAARSGITRGAGALRARLRDPRGEIGRTIRDLEAARASGITDEASFQALPKGAPGFNQAAMEAEQNIAARNEAMLAGERQNYGAEQARILGENADRHHFIPDAHEELSRLEAQNTVNGVEGDEMLGAAIRKVRSMLTAKTGVIDQGATAVAQEANPGAGAEYITAPAVKVADLVKTKRIVDSLAGYGAPATPETVPYRQLSTVLAKELEGVSPEMAALNQRYHGAMSRAEATNSMLYGKDAADVIRTPAARRQAAGMLGRIGDNTQAATLREPQIAELKAMDVGNARDIARVEAKKAIERTRYGLPHISRRIEHLPFGFVQQNASALAARELDPFLGRLSVPLAPGPKLPMEALAGLGSIQGRRNPIVDAYEAKRRRDEAAAAQLQGGP